MMAWVERTIVVPAAFVGMARAACEELAGAGGAGMFVTQLSASGTAPTTHYISSGSIEQEFAALLPLTTVTYGENGAPNVTTRPGDAATVTALATAAGLAVSAEQVGALLASVDVCDQEPFVALGRLGLALVSVE